MTRRWALALIVVWCGSMVTVGVVLTLLSVL